MMTLPLLGGETNQRILGLKMLTGTEFAGEDGYILSIGWLESPRVPDWSDGCAARESVQHSAVVAALREKFGREHD